MTNNGILKPENLESMTKLKLLKRRGIAKMIF